MNLDRLKLLDHRILTTDPSVHIYYLTGPLFFGSVNTVLEAFKNAGDWRALIISMRGVPLIDAMGIQALEQIVDTQRARGGQVCFSGLQPSVREMFARTGMIDHVGEQYIFWGADQAIVALHGNLAPAEEAPIG